jgi:hypothetical protein
VALLPAGPSAAELPDVSVRGTFENTEGPHNSRHLAVDHAIYFLCPIRTIIAVRESLDPLPPSTGAKLRVAIVAPFAFSRGDRNKAASFQLVQVLNALRRNAPICLLQTQAYSGTR